MKIINKLTLAFISLSLSLSAYAEPAKDISAVAANGTELFKGINSAAVAFFYLVGVVTFGVGCWLIYKEQSEQGRGHAKKGAVGMLIGASLLALPTMIGLTATSVAGEGSIKGAAGCIGPECL